MRFRRRLAPSATVDLVPMIDVVFQLVVFFMVSSTFAIAPGISLTLPDSSTAESVEVTRLIVSVVSEDEVYLNETRYDLAGMRQALAKMDEEERNEITTVVLDGDEEVSYSLMVEVLDVLRESGFKGVGLRTRDARSS